MSGGWRELVTDTPLHTREAVETSDADGPVERYRVQGGWLYNARSIEGGQALAFVPDTLSPVAESAISAIANFLLWVPGTYADTERAALGLLKRLDAAGYTVVKK